MRGRSGLMGLRTCEMIRQAVGMKQFHILIALALGANTAMAQVPGIFQGADLKLGEKLIADNRCVACHQQKAGGEGSAMYKPAGRVNTPGILRGMVEQCNTELNLSLFPEEVTAIAAVLNRDHYRFK
ncbi:MAG: hypothetical protein Q8R56_12795 [Polaromonas sp.]|nr:hypothetical protein [Polaromonas sp.]